jgi:hypothetical protein
MIKCPRCFTPLSAAVAGGWCAMQVCDSDAIAAAIGWRPSRRGDREPWPLPCGYGPDGHGETCGTCWYAMAPRWREAPSTCIVMAGARATGKSIYIGVLIKQLQQWAEHLHLQVRPANAEVDGIFKEHYETPLYKERGIMVPTVSVASGTAYQQEPLVYELSTVRGAHHLVVRDVAGEDMEKPQPDHSNLGFFARADGVIFLFDPLQVEEIRDKLANLVIPTQLEQGDPGHVLDNTLALIGSGRPKLAVVMSKFDAMQELRQVRQSYLGHVMGNAGAAFLRDPGPYLPYDDVEGELLHEEVRSLLKLLESGMTNPVERAHQLTGISYRYFAVSALGDAPRGKALNTRGIAPFRCLDPLRWILAGSGVL